jgi:integrase/recombinase XerD
MAMSKTNHPAPLLPLQTFVAPRAKRHALPLADWPAADQAAWQRAITPASLLDDDDAGRVAAWRPVSRHAVAQSYGVWLTFLLRRDGQLTDDPVVRLRPEQVQSFVMALREGRGWRTVGSALSHLGMAAAAMFPGEDWSWLRRMSSRARARATPSRDKAARLARPHTLLQLGQALMDEAAATRGAYFAAARYRDGLMIALLALLPLRRRNLMQLRLGDELQQQAGRWVIAIPGAQMKNHQPIAMPLPDVLAPALEGYLDQHRPVLLARGSAQASNTLTTALWLGTGGEPLADSRAWTMITAHTKRRLGVAVNPHLFRDCAASFLGDVDPEQVRLAAPLLGHASFATTERHYILANARQALRQHQEALEMRRSASGHPQKARRRAD